MTTDLVTDVQDATARLKRFAREFDLTLPELEYEDGDLLLTETLIQFIGETGGSIDFLLLGDPWPMVRSYHANRSSDRPIIAAIRQLNEQEQRIFLGGLRAYGEGVSFDDAMAAIRAVIAEVRGEQAKAA